MVSVPWPKKRREEGNDCAKLFSDLTHVHKGKLIISTHQLPSTLLSERSAAPVSED